MCLKNWELGEVYSSPSTTLWSRLSFRELDSYTNKALEDKQENVRKMSLCDISMEPHWGEWKQGVLFLAPALLASIATLHNKHSNYTPGWRFGLIKLKFCQLLSQINTRQILQLNATHHSMRWMLFWCLCWLLGLTEA